VLSFMELLFGHSAWQFWLAFLAAHLIGMTVERAKASVFLLKEKEALAY